VANSKNIPDNMANFLFFFQNNAYLSLATGFWFFFRQDEKICQWFLFLANFLIARELVMGRNGIL
jgi:hypothetical protein